MELISQYLIPALLALLGGGYFLYQRERSNRQDAEGKLKNSEVRIEDARLDEQGKQLAKEASDSNAKLRELEEKDLKVEDLSPEDVEKHWNKK